MIEEADWGGRRWDRGWTGRAYECKVWPV